MDETKKPDQNQQAAVEKNLIDKVDVSKEGIRSYLEDAAERLSTKDDKVAWTSGSAMKAACFMLIADIMKADGELRKQASRHWMASPIWFGSNASAGRQAYEAKTKVEAMKNYEL